MNVSTWSRVAVLCLGLMALAGCGGDPSGGDGGPGGGDGECVVGTQGCACAEGDRCAPNARGETVLCQAGVCEAMTCVAGERECVCRGGTTCASPADECVRGFCLASRCAPGTRGCGCLAGTCDPGLTCLEGVTCVDSTGFEGGACLPNGRCNRGARCDTTSSTCVFCEPGSAGCQCTQAQGCNAGLVCSGGQCLSADRRAPSKPSCYTPCLDDLELDGGIVSCGPDGLMAGCLPGQTCVSGSCVAPGGSPPSCQDDLMCPFFQVCLEGGCYANCEASADCPSGMGCFRKACRQSCSTARSPSGCPSGYACTASDGENGFCLPVGTAAPDAGSSTAPVGSGVEVGQGVLQLSNVATTASVQLIPSGSGTMDVTVRKLYHQISYADGRTERVDAPRDSAGQFRTCDPARNECPLWWLRLGAPGEQAVQTPTLAMRLIPGCTDTRREGDAGSGPACPELRVENAAGVQAVRWEGALEITTRSARTTVQLTYVERPEGQWLGSMYYFGSFSTVGLDAWKSSSNKSEVSQVGNGLIQRWGSLRGGRLEGWEEFLAVLTSTRTESWRFGTVASRCRAISGNDPLVACYPYINTAGIRPYVQNVNNAPIPSGATELPIAMNLRIDPANPARFIGRVESTSAMHYPGNPAMAIEFRASPAQASACATGTGGPDCLVFLKDPAPSGVNQLTLDLGGRYFPPEGGTCAAGFTPTPVPYLVPGLTEGTQVENGQRTRIECRDAQLPFDPAGGARNVALNQSLAGGNPVPDGQPRRRVLTFIDGALVNQSELFILFEESYQSFIPGQAPTRAYGYMLLKRVPSNLDPDAYTGLTPVTALPSRPVPVPPGAQCDPTLVQEVLNKATPAPVSSLQADERRALAKVLISGLDATSGYVELSPTDPANRIHTYCEDTGFFNGGPSLTERVPCPAGSRVVYFNAGARTDAQMAAEACNTRLSSDGRGTCQNTLNLWRLAANVIVEENPLFRCTDAQEVLCDDDRLDLRKDKTFFRKQAAPTRRTFLSLRAVISDAFRYKTRFRSTSGQTLGFAPVECVPNSDQVPYCYSPPQIQEARQRVDCLVDLYTTDAFIADLQANAPALKTELEQFLRGNFAEFSAPDGMEGFERLYAELLIMLGDESLTAAYASRFDLASTMTSTFRGSAFEVNGIDLTGVAGAEMYRLHQAVQYYQLALDRLYRFGPDMQVALSRGPVGSDVNFITPEMITSYLERLVRAASQKARAYGEIARRYQNFNRPDLARAVIERSYVGTYLESALVSWLMLDIARQSTSASIPQITITIEKSQRNYRMALLDMREIYGQITDAQNFFGFPPDYIPFPPIDGALASVSAFENLLTLARQRLDLARSRELTALSSARQGRVDLATFQSDLATLRNTYENQLASICGTFPVDDGRIVPATRTYAPLSAVATAMGDPCGRFGNGDLHNAMGAAKDARLRFRAVQQRFNNTVQEIDVERARVAQQCALTSQVADLQYSIAERQATVAEKTAEMRAYMNLASSLAETVIDALEVADCEIQCASSVAMAATATAAGAAAAAATLATELTLVERQAELAKFERDTMRLVNNAPCAAGQIDSIARVADLTNNLLEIEIEALRAEYAIRLAVGDVVKLSATAQRLAAQQEEAQQLSINIQAAQNDPNVRIYQNDAVINADVSFHDALSLIYRLTRVFEYYTSQSYAKKEQLFLIRMVTAGQYNLENYLLELENEFNAFEEAFGNPDVRVLALSLRDDILQIPTLKPSGQPYTEAERIALMRQRLSSVELLDSRGYLTLPFSTRLDSLSPLTRNHKVRHVEIDLQGSRMGDPTARVYLRMSGTGVVRNVNDDLDYFVFPERTAVVNASLLGSKVYDLDVYRNYRFRDRPLVNTLWELILNQRDEQVNRDIDLQTLTDVRVLLYYSDFTTF